MITKKNINKKQAKHILKLLKRWTRCEIMARHGRFDNLGYIDYALKEVEYRDKIRKYLYGDSNLAELGIKWKMLKKTIKGRLIPRKKRKE